LVKTDPGSWKPTLMARKESDQADKDQENEQFKRHFKTSKDILESHLGGPIQLTTYVKLVCAVESEI